MSDVEMESGSSWDDEPAVQFYEKVPLDMRVYNEEEADCILTLEKELAALEAQVYDERGDLRPFEEEPSLKQK